MTELEVTFTRAARFWWAYTWRMLLIMLMVGIVLGFISVPFGGIVDRVMRIIIILISIPIGVWVFMLVLRKRYRKFKVILLPADDAD